jgi:translation initiation factor 2 subunit 1
MSKVEIKPRKPLPDVGELVVGTINEVYDFGAYLSIDEYGGIRAFLPWSEVATRMVRNIRQVLKEGQKVVVKVIRVYKARNQVDVSLKRVTDAERKRKMMWWKRLLKASSIVRMVAERIGKSEDEAFREVIWRLDDYYGDPLTGLERAVIYGEKALRDARVPEEWIKPLLEEARARIEIKYVKISGIFTLTSMAGDGVKRIRSVLEAVRSAVEKYGGDQVKVRIYSVGSPRYRIDLQSHEYKIIERVLAKAIEEGRRVANELEVGFAFERLKT